MRRTVRDEEDGPARTNALRAASKDRRERGQGVFRYDRAALARICGLRPSAIYSAERRGRLDVADLVSVARYVLRRLERNRPKGDRP